MLMSHQLWKRDKFEKMCEITRATTRIRATNYEKHIAIDRTYPLAGIEFTEKKRAALLGIEASIANDSSIHVQQIAFIDDLCNVDLLVDRTPACWGGEHWVLVYKHFGYQ